MKSNLMNHKEVLFIGSFLSDEIKDELQGQSIGLRSNANDLFQKNTIKGLLKNNCQVYQISIPNIGSFPKKYKKILTPKLVTANTTSFRFLNITGIKQVCHIYSLLNYTVFNTKRIKALDLVIVYDLYSPFLLILPLIKCINPHVKICVVIPDLPEFTGTTLKTKVASYIPKYTFKYTRKSIDCFSLIAPAMREKLSINKKESIIIEGLYDPNMSQTNCSNEPTDNKVILYSGTLDKRNGIIHLIEAFEKMKYKNKELHIYGDGPLKDYILKSSKNNGSIRYFGQIDNFEVIEKYPFASLLVNPRLPTGVFTKYSFPSKTLEYLASGVPVVMYKLEGLPDEYIDYIITPNNLSFECLAQTMDRYLTSNEKTEKLARKAKEFILSEKTYEMQVSRMLDFIFKLPGFEHDKP